VNLGSKAAKKKPLLTGSTEKNRSPTGARSEKVGIVRGQQPAEDVLKFRKRQSTIVRNMQVQGKSQHPCMTFSILYQRCTAMPATKLIFTWQTSAYHILVCADII